MATDQVRLRKLRGSYGIDGGASAVLGLIGMGLVGFVLLECAILHIRSDHILLALLELLIGLTFLQAVPSYLYSTYRGKFLVWAELVDALSLRGDEQVLDLGCGRGAVLGIAARVAPRGRAIGLDLWRSEDQSGNSPEAARRNLEAEGVQGHCELKTGDMRAIPFADNSFDLVVSSLAIHNIKRREDRNKAVGEAVRVLRPGGRLLVADLTWTKAYAKQLIKLGMQDVVTQHLGWRFWFGALGTQTGLVVARKPVVPHP
jgi:SAM-dependent methyltransferase